MIRFLLFPAIITLLAIMVCQAQDNDQETALDPVSSRELIRQWVQTERIISEEKLAWQVQKQRMEELLGIYQKELSLLDEELSTAGNSAQLIDDNREDLEASITRYRDANQRLEESMSKLLPRMLGLVSMFPQPLLDELALDISALNEATAIEQPRDVLKSMIAVLSAASRFNRSITVVEETRVVQEAKKITVDTIYIGLCRAFYASGAGDVGGVGTPAKQGWVWTDEPGVAEQVRRLIAVHRKSEQPQLIELPIQLITGEVSQ